MHEHFYSLIYFSTIYPLVSKYDIEFDLDILHCNKKVPFLDITLARYGCKLWGWKLVPENPC